MRRYSKRDREDAALICSAGACNPDAYCVFWIPTHLDADLVAASLGASERALDLALDAWLAVTGHPPIGAEREAEAEALIRTGWSPK